jgi:hypothetical protein
MSFVFNPFTKKFDFVEKTENKDKVKKILIDSNQAVDLSIASILFDDDSILYCDDEAEV